MNNKEDVRSVAREYACLLFLKQWTTYNTYGYTPLDYPQIPSDQAENKVWEEHLKYIKDKVSKILDNEKLLKNTGLHIITREWCSTKGYIFPIDYLDILENKIKEKFKTTLIEQAIDQDKIESMKGYTIETIKEVFNDISRIKGKDVDKQDAISTAVFRGIRRLLDKEAFVENTSTSYIGFEEIVGNELRYQYYNYFATNFYLEKTISYEVPNGQLFDALDKLSLNKDKHIIVSFNVNIQYLKDYMNIPITNSTGIENYSYKSIPIYSFDISIPHVYSTLYVLSKDNLPMIKHKDWSKIETLESSDIERWKSMDCINTELKLYMKITELNTASKVLQEYVNIGEAEEELKNMIEINVDLIGYCWFKKNSKIVEIKESDIFQEGDVRNDIENIKPFE